MMFGNFKIHQKTGHRVNILRMEILYQVISAFKIFFIFILLFNKYKPLMNKSLTQVRGKLEPVVKPAGA